MTTSYNGNPSAVAARAMPSIPVSLDGDDLNSTLLNTPLTTLADVLAFLQSYAVLLGPSRPNQDTLQLDGQANDQVAALKTRRPAGNVKLLWEADIYGATKIRLYSVNGAIGTAQPGFTIAYNCTLAEAGGGVADGSGGCFWYSFGSAGIIVYYFNATAAAAFTTSQMTRTWSFNGPTGVLELRRGESTWTPGDATLDTPRGVSAIPANASTVRITNKFVSFSSTVLVSLQNAYTGEGIFVTAVAPGNGSFDVFLNKAVSATIPFAWLVIN